MVRQRTTPEVEGEIEAVETADFYLDPQAQMHIMRILRDMYNDPAWAVLREFISNALDAHRDPEADIGEIPIEVTLPNNFNNNNLTIRDYGPGLSVEGFKKYMLGYGVTGDSKWIHDNQIGGFGIGAKSFAAVSDSAVFRCYHDGMVANWLCQHDQSEAGRPKLTKHEYSDEHSGIEVNIPIDTNQYPNLYEKLWTLIQYVDYPMKIDGILYNTPLSETKKQEEPVLDFNCQNLGRTMIFSNRSSGLGNYPYRGRFDYDLNDPDFAVILINDIPYPLRNSFITQSVQGTKYEESMHTLLNYNKLIISVPDNFFELAPNREGFIQNQTSGEACKRVAENLCPELEGQADSTIRYQESKKQAVFKALEMGRSGLYPPASKVDTVSELLESNLYIPYGGNSQVHLYDFMTVTKPTLENLSATVYLGGFRPYKTSDSIPTTQSTLLSLNTEEDQISNIFSTSLLDSIRFDNTPIHGLTFFKTSRGMRGFDISDLLRSARYPVYVYSQLSPHSNVSPLCLFKYPIKLVWVPENQTIRGVAPKFIKPRHTDYQSQIPPAWGAAETSEDFKPELPVVFIHGNQKQRDEAIKAFGDLGIYEGDINNDYYYQNSKQYLQKPSSAKNKTKSEKHKVNAQWFCLDQEQFHRAKNSDYWYQCERPDSKFLYVYLDRFEPHYPDTGSQNRPDWNDLKCYTNEEIMKFVKFIKNIYGEQLEVYGIKKANKDKKDVIPQHAEMFPTYIYEILKKWVNPKSKNKFKIDWRIYQFLTKYYHAMDPTPSPFMLKNGNDNIQYKYIVSLLNKFIYHGFVQSASQSLGKQHMFVESIKELQNKLNVPDEVLKNIRKSRSIDQVLETPHAVDRWLDDNQNVKAYDDWMKTFNHNIESLQKKYQFLVPMFQYFVECNGRPHNWLLGEFTDHLLDYMKGIDTVKNK